MLLQPPRIGDFSIQSFQLDNEGFSVGGVLCFTIWVSRNQSIPNVFHLLDRPFWIQPNMRIKFTMGVVVGFPSTMVMIMGVGFPLSVVMTVFLGIPEFDS